ncbi:MAG: xanthine dehydrogenase family protein subunit M [Burkholderiaceae bacterium]
MKPAAFHYHRATSVEQAVSLLQSCGGEARPIAGGQSLSAMMNMRLAEPSHLIDLRAIPGLSAIDEQQGCLVVGAMATHQAVATSPQVIARCPMLAHAAGTIGHYAIRKQGTLGGSLAHADPAAQIPLVAVALDTQIDIVGPAGKRSLPAGQFFEGLMTTALAPDELIVAARFAPIDTGQGQSFRLFNLRHGDFAIVAVAVDLRLQGDDLASLRLVLGGVGPVPLALDTLAADFVGHAADATLARRVAGQAQSMVDPFDSPGVSAQYRRELIEVLVEGAMLEAIDRAQAAPDGAP